MIIVWGFRTYVHLLGISTMVCRQCGNPAAHRVEKVVRKFTLFWIPLFPVRQRVLITCTFCGVTHQIPKEEQPALLQALQSTGTAAPTAAPAAAPASEISSPPDPRQA